MVEAELAKTEAAIERYLLAFEAGTMPEGGVRGTASGISERKGPELRSRRAELEYEIADAAYP